MSHEQEHEEWREYIREWQAESPPPSPLLEQVQRATRRQWRSVVSSVVAVTAAMAYIGAVVARHPQPAVIIGAVGAFLLCVPILVLYLLSTFGTWREKAFTTRDFVELRLARCDSQIRHLRLGRWVAIAGAGFVLAYGLVLMGGHIDTLGTPRIIVIKMVLALGVIVTAWIYAHRRLTLLSAEREYMKRVATSLINGNNF